MLFTALRDMQWRLRRFVIAIISTALVFAMTLVLTGLQNGFRVEARHTVNSLGVDMYLIRKDASGPFLGASPFPAAVVQSVQGTPGVTAAAPLVYAGTTYIDGNTTRNADLFGAPPQGPGMPDIYQGHAPSSPDEIAVSSTMGRQVGDDVEIGGHKLHIVGIVENSTALAKLPNVFLTVEGAQQLKSGGQPLISSIGIRGTIKQIPDGYRVVDRAAAFDDLLRPLRVAVDAITIVSILLWVLAALIVGAIVYLSTLARLRDFAVFKAIGVPTRALLAGQSLQAVIVAIVAAGLGAAVLRRWPRCSR